MGTVWPVSPSQGGVGGQPRKLQLFTEALILILLAHHWVWDGGRRGDKRPLLWPSHASVHLGAEASDGVLYLDPPRRVTTCHHHLQGQPPTSALTYDTWLNFPAELQLREDLLLKLRLKAGAALNHFTLTLGPSPTRAPSTWIVLQSPSRQNHCGNAGRVSPEQEGKESHYFLEADIRVWRKSGKTNGYRISGMNILREDTQVFQSVIWVLNPSLESPEQTSPAFLSEIWLAHGIPIIPSHLKKVR